MANHYRVSPKYWLWARRRGLSDAQTTLGLYLLTCTHRNLEGLYRLPKAYAADDLHWTVEKVELELAAVIATGFALYDDDAGMVLIPKALKHQSPTTPNQITGAINQLRRIPRTSLWDDFRSACALHCPKLAEAIETEWPSHGHRMDSRPEAKLAESDAMAVAWPSHDDASLARSHAGAHAGPSSSSISSSTSSPPLAPPAIAGGEQGLPGDASLPKNSRAHGTNPRSVADRVIEGVAAAQAEAAAAALGEPSDDARSGWQRLRPAMLGCTDSPVTLSYIESLDLVAVDGDELVLDGPQVSMTWAAARFRRALSQLAEGAGVRVRLATPDEHEGFAAVAA